MKIRYSPAENSSILREKIKSFPKTPGIYQFLNNRGSVLYVGKAKSLRDRLNSYFVKENSRRQGKALMMAQAVDIKIIGTESEIEAVILEADLIGKLKPRFNIKEKDDKSFLMVKITKEDFPRVSLIRYKNADLYDKTASYFGPYPGGYYLKKSLRYLRRIFPFIDCTTTKFNRQSKFARACLYGDLGICPRLCIDESNKGEYRRNINYLKSFLRGRKKDVIAKIRKEMEEASQLQQFEKAAVLRDRFRALLHIGEVAIGLKDDFVSPGQLAFPRIEGFDISNISGQFAVGAMVVFGNGKPDKAEYRKFRIKYLGFSIWGKQTGDKKDYNPNTKYQTLNSKNGDIQMMRQVLERRFGHKWPLPDLIVIDGGVAHLNLAREIIQNYRWDILIVAIAKGRRRDKDEFHYSDHALAKYIQKNSELKRICLRVRDESHRFAQSYYRQLHQRNLLES